MLSRFMHMSYTVSNAETNTIDIHTKPPKPAENLVDQSPEKSKRIQKCFSYWY